MTSEKQLKQEYEQRTEQIAKNLKELADRGDVKHRDVRNRTKKVMEACKDHEKELYEKYNSVRVLLVKIEALKVNTSRIDDIKLGDAYCVADIDSVDSRACRKISEKFYTIE